MGKATTRMRARRTKRRNKRKADERELKERRAQADEYQEEAVGSARAVQANLPSEIYQQDQLDRLESRGSSAARLGVQDAEGLAAQRRAMGQQEQIANQGYTSQDAATLQSANRQSNLNEQSQRQAIQQQAAMRGQSGGGLAMMGALAAQQGGANRAADQAAQVGQNRIQARQQGVQNLAQQGSALAGQGLAQGQAQGQALDAFNQNMTTARMGVPQQGFQNQLAASQNFQGAATGAAAYGQQTADAKDAKKRSLIQKITDPGDFM